MSEESVLLSSVDSFEYLGDYIYTSITEGHERNQDPLPDVNILGLYLLHRIEEYHVLTYGRLIHLLSTKSNRFVPINKNAKAVSNGDWLKYVVEPSRITINMRCWMTEIVDAEDNVERNRSRLLGADVIITYEASYDYKPKVVVLKTYYDVA